MLAVHALSLVSGLLALPVVALLMTGDDDDDGEDDFENAGPCPGCQAPPQYGWSHGLLPADFVAYAHEEGCPVGILQRVRGTEHAICERCGFLVTIVRMDDYGTTIECLYRAIECPICRNTCGIGQEEYFASLLSHGGRVITGTRTFKWVDDTQYFADVAALRAEMELKLTYGCTGITGTRLHIEGDRDSRRGEYTTHVDVTWRVIAMPDTSHSLRSELPL